MAPPDLFGDDPALIRPATPAPAADESRGQTSSLYRRYRPRSFDPDDLVGQEHVVQTLRNAIMRGRVAHAYLFCGPRGTGKTTTARLLAKAVNCLAPEVDQRPCNACAACDAINSGATTEKFTPRAVREAPRGQGCPMRIAAKEPAGSSHKLGVRGGGVCCREASMEIPSRWSHLEPPATSPAIPQVALEEGRPPQPVAPGLWLFAPNRDTAGGSAWLLDAETGPVLVDAPALTQANLVFLSQRPKGLIVLTGRDGHGASEGVRSAAVRPGRR
jgi:DNA polymerase III delta prime subunit